MQVKDEAASQLVPSAEDWSLCIMLAQKKLFMMSVWQVVWQRAEINSSQWLACVNMEMTWPQRKLFPGCVSLQDQKKQLLYNVCRKSMKFRVCVHVSHQLAWNLEILVGVKVDKKCCSPEIICENCARSTKNIVNKVFKQGSNLPCGEANCSDLLKFRGPFLKWNNLRTVCGLMESVKRPTKD